MSQANNVDLSQMPADAKEGTVFLLTIRGALKPPSLEQARPVHNMTAGNPEGVAAARSLGDLSHNVYRPVGEDTAHEILILDRWTSVQGLGQFFADPQVQEGGNMIFESRDPVVWAPTGGFGCHLPAPSDRKERYVGMLRAPINDAGKTRAAFDKANRENLNRARLHGQIADATYFRVPLPDQPADPEVLALSLWHDLDGMNAFYRNTDALAYIGDLVASAPTTSIWTPAEGEWVEW